MRAAWEASRGCAGSLVSRPLHGLDAPSSEQPGQVAQRLGLGPARLRLHEGKEERHDGCHGHDGREEEEQVVDPRDVVASDLLVNVHWCRRRLTRHFAPAPHQLAVAQPLRRAGK